MRNAFCHLAVSMLVAGAALAAPVDVRLDPTEVRVGDPVTVTVSVEVPEGGRGVIPPPSRPSAADLRVEAVPVPAGERIPGRTLARFRVVPFETGDLDLFRDPVRIFGADGEETTLAVDATLPVRSVLPDGDEPVALRPDKPAVSWPARWLGPGLLAFLAAWALALAALAVLWARRRHRPRAPAAPTAPRHSPAVLALRALDELARSERFTAPDPEPFYRRASDIVRTYLERELGLHAPEQTTPEFLADAASSHRLESGLQRLTAEFLEACDLVKFARHRPDPEDRARVLAAARRLVEETRRPPVEVKAA